jgi:hypothetical protein
MTHRLELIRKMDFFFVYFIYVTLHPRTEYLLCPSESRELKILTIILWCR